MTSPSKPAVSDGQLPLHDDQVAARIMRKLRGRVDDLIDENAPATLPRKGKKARSVVQIPLELYDADGNLIFG